MNHWLRARVVIQGVTIVALVAGSMALQAKKNTGISTTEDELPRSETETELSREKKILERQEFEERLKVAEVAAEQEERLGMMTVKGPSLSKGREEKKTGQVTQQADASKSPVLNEVKKNDSWRWWWSSSKNSETQVKSKPDSMS